MQSNFQRALIQIQHSALALFSTFGVALSFGVFQDFYTVHNLVLEVNDKADQHLSVNI